MLLYIVKFIDYITTTTSIRENDLKYYLKNQFSYKGFFGSFMAFPIRISKVTIQIAEHLKNERNNKNIIGYLK